MLGWFKKKRFAPGYASMDTPEKIAAAVRRGVLVPLSLDLAEGGSRSTGENVVFVPEWVVREKAWVDEGAFYSVARAMHFRHYRASAAYRGRSLVPVSITVHVYDPGYFSTVIEIW